VSAGFKQKLRRERNIAAAWKTADRMVDLHSCHTCKLGIEMRYGVSGPRSTNQGYWSHMATLAGVAADKDHTAVR
jgi:hypothetical protein